MDFIKWLREDILFDLKFGLVICLRDLFCLDESLLDEIFIFVYLWSCVCKGVVIDL